MNNTTETTAQDAEAAVHRQADGQHAEAGDVIPLHRDRMLSLRNACDTRIYCVSGLLWVTEHRRVTDVVLKPGESFEIGHQDLALVIALEDSRVLVEHGKGDPIVLDR